MDHVISSTRLEGEEVLWKRSVHWRDQSHGKWLYYFPIALPLTSFLVMGVFYLIGAEPKLYYIYIGMAIPTTPLPFFFLYTLGLFVMVFLGYSRASADWWISGTLMFLRY